MEYYDDSLVMLSGAWRVICGHKFHADFSSLYGFIYFSIIALGMKIGGICSRALIYGPAIVFPFLSLWAWSLAKKRLSSTMSLLFSMMVGSLFIGNYALGVHDFKVFSYSMSYNRLGWSLVCILILQLLLPLRNNPSTKRILLEGISIGSILAILFFLKINYIFAGLLALFLIPLRLKATRFIWIGTAGAFFSISLLLSYFMKISFNSYIQDVVYFVKLNEGLSIPQRILSRGIANLGPIVLVFFIFMILNLSKNNQNKKGYLQVILLDIITLSATILLGLFICAGNNQVFQIPLFSIGGIVLCEDFWRRFINQSNNSPMLLENKLRYSFSSLLSVYLIALIFLPDLGSVANSLKKRNLCHHSAHSIESVIDSNSLKDLNFLKIPSTLKKKGSPEKLYPSATMLLNDGIRLLKKYSTKKSRIFTMAYHNPFPFALGLPAPRGGMLVWHYERSYSDYKHPPPELLFKEANLIMIKAESLNPPSPMIRIYFPYIQREFKRIDESDYWILYRK
jgi:hypothetical protein